MIERRLGEIFEHTGDEYIVEEASGCDNCGFKAWACIADKWSVTGHCEVSRRKDMKSVIFRKIKTSGGKNESE